MGISFEYFYIVAADGPERIWKLDIYNHHDDTS